MKKFLTLLLCVVLIVCFMPTMAFADGGENGNTATSGNCGATDSDKVTWKLTQNNNDSDNPTYTLTISGNGAMEDYVRPSDDGNHVPWADYSTCISAVVVEDGITHIGVRSFNTFTALTSVSLAESVESIGNRAFEGCSKLENITLPKNVTVIEDATFYYCSQLESVNLDSVTVIKPNAFDGCAALTSVDLTSLTEMGNYAFQACSALSSVILGDNIKALPTGAFIGCSNLKSITIPDSLTTIGGYCFYNTGLTSIDLNHVNTIASTYAFAKCTSLKSVKMDDLSGKLLGSTFSGCTALTEITIPAGITDVTAGSVFANCTSLKTLTLEGAADSANITLGQSAFSGLTGLTTLIIDRNVINNRDNLAIFTAWDSDSGLDVSFGDSVTNVPKKLLGGTANAQLINRITFGKNVKSVDGNAFSALNTIKTVDLTAVTELPSNIELSNMITGSVIYVSTSEIVSSLIGTLDTSGRNYAEWKTAVAVLDGGALPDDYKPVLEELSDNNIKPGYTFAGWYSDETLSTKVEDNKIKSSNSDYGTYYAKWEQCTTHTYGDPTWTWTETDDGYSAEAVFKCTKCAEPKTESATVSRVITPATCTEHGKTAYTATVNFENKEYTDTKEVVILATGHTEVIDAAVDATCTSTGLTEGKHCSVCGEVLVEQVTVPTIAHTPGAAKKENVVAPTSTKAGSYDSVVYCTVCSKELSREKITVPATGTSYYPTVQKPVIETSEGVTASLNSTGTIATITVADGYELADVTVNGVSKGAVTTLTGLKTGDKVVVTAKKTEEPPVVDDSARIKAGVQATTLKIYSKSLNTKGSGKGWIQVRWVKSKGFKVDGYELYRGKTKSTMKRYDTTTKTTYTNKNYLKKGSRYYYKVRGYRMINGEKVYTQWSKTIYRLAK